MSKVVVGLYDDLEHARMAVEELEQNGFHQDMISLVTGDASSRLSGQMAKEHRANEITEGAAGGAAGGAVLGGLAGLLVGLGALAIPGIGPAVAAGPLATTLAGAGLGAAAGGIVGALVKAGVPQETAEIYAEGIRRGGTLVMVESSDQMAQHAVDIMDRHDPVEIERRAEQWRSAHWQGFDPNAQPYADAGAAPMEDRSFRKEDADLDEYDNAFRQHYDTTFSNTDYSYFQFRPYYEYGYQLARDDRFHNHSWDEIEMDARRDWERSHPDSLWDDFKEAVRAGWETVTGRR